MAKKIAEFESKYRDKKPDESILDYYSDLRSDQLSYSSLEILEGGWNSLNEYRKEEQIDNFGSIDPDVVRDFIHYLREKDDINKDSTVKTKVDVLSNMISWFNKKGIMSGNPFEEAIEEVEFNDEPTPKIEIPINDLIHGIMNIKKPVVLVFVIIALKTGARISELVNLDERDLNINHPISEILDEPRPKLAGKQDTIWIDSTINKGDIVNGEERNWPNKEKSSRAIPLDKESKQALVWYLAMRPVPNSDANPIFVKTAGGPNTSIGDRHSVETLRDRFNKWADKHGWYDSNNPASMKPHWCRHWFTTMVRSNVNPDIIEVGTKDDFEDYLRGDTSSETKSDYIQMTWGSNHWMKEALEDALPNLFVENVNNN